MAGEFEIIRRYFSEWPVGNSRIELGVGDDCAVIKHTPDERVVISVDTLVSGMHFLPETPAEIIGYRALAVSVSDLASMGAEPVGFTLALTIPSPDEKWLSEFSLGLQKAAEDFSIALVGGDTTKGPLTLSLQVMGAMTGNPLKRDGAQPGELVVVSGSLGDAGLGLIQARQHSTLHLLSLDEMLASSEAAIARFLCPTPRVQLGRALVGYASSCIDISDGLLADVSHIAEASGVGIELYADRLPFSDEMLSQVLNERRRMALTAGDDYELCFTISDQKLKELTKLFKARDQITPLLTVIGEVTDSGRVVVLDEFNNPLTLQSSGYTHF